MAAQSVARAAEEVEPNALPRTIYCACCPAEVEVNTTLLTESNGQQLDPPVEYLEERGPFNHPDLKRFRSGRLFRVCVGGRWAYLDLFELNPSLGPRAAGRCRMPRFGLRGQGVIWVCPSCDRLFKGQAFNVEQYLAAQARTYRFLDQEVHFKLSASSDV